MKRILCLILSLLLLVSLSGCYVTLPEDVVGKETSGLQIVTDGKDTRVQTSPAPDTDAPTDAPVQTDSDENQMLDEDGWYNTKDEVALYIHQYGKLPGNYITKKEAEALGWSGGSLEPYAPGKSIGGTYFGNYEELLPKKKGRSYTECDIDTAGKSSRGAKRIVFSNDGLIYYTDDHYESFTLLYGTP